jgi:tetratricopeptide (TPR) repeat protein
MKTANKIGCILILVLAATGSFSFAGETNHLSQSDEWVVEGALHVNEGAFDEAISDFSKAIESGPTNANAIFNRASVYRAKGEFEESIKDFDRYILLNPTNDLAFKNRASDFAGLGKFNKAIDDWSEGLRLKPNDATALAMRGMCYNNKGRFEDALKDYYQAIKIDSTNASAWNNLAWFRATCPTAAMRNGKEAVEAATKACDYSSWKNWMRVDTLAAAFAEAGDFQQAVKYQKQALNMDKASSKERQAMQSRLVLYEQRQPYRQN